jgi:hypothetical protein
MARRCTVCAHPERLTIEKAVLAGAAVEPLARAHGLSDEAIANHTDRHLSRQLLKAHNLREVARADLLLAEVRAVQARARRLADLAEQATDYRTALLGIRQELSCLELLAKLTGAVDERPTVNVTTLTVTVVDDRG